MRCLHCEHERHIERRGLCRSCYRDRTVRARYPSLNPPLPVPPGCLHCKRNKAQRGKRGLCFSCHQDREIRALYPLACKPPDDGVRPGHAPAKPTHHPPGSWEKLKVMCERFDRGESLFHPGDAKRMDYVTAADLLPRGHEGRAAG